MPSRWEVALGDRIDRLRPELRAYCGALLPGSEGIGRGTFEIVGTPHRWLRPVLVVVGGPSLFPIRARTVPFAVRDRSVAGRAAVAATRMIHAGRSTRGMSDEIAATTERFDPDDGVQRVALTVDAPIVGRIYEYRGSFTYSIRARKVT